jgi:hypothetical protein
MATWRRGMPVLALAVSVLAGCAAPPPRDGQGIPPTPSDSRRAPTVELPGPGEGLRSGAPSTR